MKIRLLTCLIVAVAVAGLAPLHAMAQAGEQSGSAGASYLLVPVTAQSAALGSSMTAGLASVNGIEALYANPGGLMQNQGTSVLFSRMNYVADIGVNTLGAAYRVGNNNLALLVTAWDMGDIPLQTEERPEKTELTWNAPIFYVGASYARQFTDRIAAGVTAKVLSETIDDLNASGFAFDAGMTYTVGESGLRFGVSLRNFGPQMSYSGDGLLRETGGTSRSIPVTGFELPSELNFGISYLRHLGSDASVALLGNFRSNAYDTDQFAGGLEFGLRDILFLRGGFQMQEDLDDSFYEGWNLGAGLNLDFTGLLLKVDYAYRSTRYFDGVQMFTASVTL